jgi:transcriptional regulator with XRE-family HTH domain
VTRLLLAARAATASAIVIARSGAGDSVGFGSATKLSALPVSVRVARMKAIDQVRQAHGFSIERLSSEANVAGSWYRKIAADPARASEGVLSRLASALRRLREGQRQDEAMHASLVAASYGGFLAAICREQGLDVALVRAADPRAGKTADATWRATARARQLAIYLTNISLGVQQRVLARAVGLTPAAICLGLKTIEDLRDDPVIDALIERCARQVTGHAA